MEELKVDYNLKCHLCGAEVYYKQIGLHYKKTHSTSLVGETYLKYFEYNFPGTITELIREMQNRRISSNQVLGLIEFNYIPVGFHSQLRQLLKQYNVASDSDINKEKNKRAALSNLEKYGKRFSEAFEKNMGGFKNKELAVNASTKFWQSADGHTRRELLKKNVYSPEFIEKRKKTLIERYGYCFDKKEYNARGRMSKWHAKCKRKLIRAGINSVSEYHIKKLGFYIDEFIIDKNICIEFNGDFWHMNPNIFKADEVNNVIRQSASEIWAHDEQRRQKLRDCGYRVFEIWESDNILLKIAELKELLK